MARRIRYGKGKASIEITGPQRELFEQALREVAGETMKVLEDEIDNRVKEAKENWIVRYGKPITTKAVELSYENKSPSVQWISLQMESVSCKVGKL